jgi:regulator of nonsense transcripts 2
LGSLLPELLNVLASSNPTPSAATPATDRDKEEKDRVVRLRPVLRVIAELGLVGAWENVRGGKANKGVFNDQVGQEHVYERIKGLVSCSHLIQLFEGSTFCLCQMSGDPTYSNIPLLITFLKSYKRAYLGDTASPDLATANGSHRELVSPDLQSKFRQLFEAYFATASKALVKGQTVS